MGIKTIDMNQFAKAVTLREGRCKSLSVAQVKEVTRLVLEELAKLPFDAQLNVIKRYAPKAE